MVNRNIVVIVALFCTFSMYGQKRVRTVKDTLQNVVVLSQQRERDLKSTAPVFSVTSIDFKRFGISDISTATHSLPGVTLRDYGGAGGMKTASVRGFGAQHTAVTYDGVTLSDCQSGQIDLSQFSLDNVSSMSLIVGDNDNIFLPARSAASPANLSLSTIITPTDDPSLHMKALVRGGSWAMINPFLRLEKSFSHKFSMSLSGDFFHALNNYPYTIMNVTKKTSDRRRNSLMNAGRGELNMVCQPSENNLLSLKLYYYDNSRQLPGQVHYYVNDSKETQRDQNAFVQLTWRSIFSQKFRLNYLAKFNYTMMDYKDPSYRENLMDHQYWQREAYTSASLLYTVNKSLSLDYAIDYAFNNLTGSDEGEYRSPLRHTILQTMAVRYTIGRLTAVGRLLYSLYYNGASEGKAADDISHMSPSISLSFKLLKDKELYLRASYKNIFRAPSFNELYYRHYGSTDLKPESTNQFNLGVAWNQRFAINTSMSLSVDGYYNNVTDKIVAVPQTMYMWTTVNLGKVQTVGLDFTLRVEQQLAKKHSLLFTGNYTLQSVRDHTDCSKYYGNQLAYTPEHMANVALSWENPWVNLSFSGFMVTSRWANNEHYQDTRLNGYSDWNVSAYREFRISKSEALSFRFDIKNIFDNQYEIVRLYPMPCRSWQATVQYTM